jgi:hypothetical protein
VAKDAKKETATPRRTETFSEPLQYLYPWCVPFGYAHVSTSSSVDKILSPPCADNMALQRPFCVLLYHSILYPGVQHYPHFLGHPTARHTMAELIAALP